MMFDSQRSGKRWNITFYDYSSNIGGVEAGPEYSKLNLSFLIMFSHSFSVRLNTIDLI